MRISSTIPTYDIDPTHEAESIAMMGPSAAQLRLWHAQMQRDKGVLSGEELAKLERTIGGEARRARTIFNPYTGEVRKVFLPDWYGKHRETDAPVVGWRDVAEDSYFRGMQLLLRGDYARGFAAYELRWKTRWGRAHARRSNKPQWTGQSLLGKTIYVWHEQGFGDSIMMHRYIPLLEEKAKQVHLELPEPLVR